jgi:hypothetical protein
MIFVILIVALVAAALGAKMATARGYSAGLMAVICFLFPIGVLVLAFLPKRESADSSPLNSGELSETLSERWTLLKSVDPDIADAAAEAAALGPRYEAELEKKYFVLNDKKYLPALVDSLIVQHRDEHEPNGALEVASKGGSFNSLGEYVCNMCQASNIYGSSKCESCGSAL